MTFDKVITTVLVANRGEVVSRIARTASKLGIRTVGVYSETDANSAYLADVDAAVALGDDSGASVYLDPQAIIDAAKTVGADAVHPGYGFLAENADFAAACMENGLSWIGPSPECIREMGEKIRAKDIAREAGVPVLESLTVDSASVDVSKFAHDVGFPLLVKPAAGGGGKGMHRIDDLQDIGETLDAARREALSAFGDGSLFIERFIEHGRHVEVQIVGDHYGKIVSLGDRDCSIQRRHQKIVEEAPAPSLSDSLRVRLSSAAIALARQIGYVGAGTVEFLVYDDELAFLEMNTRLQVEHAVTEEVTGLDIVELQLRVASGEPLPVAQDDVEIAGHAIEVRLYAEDPAQDFLPSPGMIRKLEVPALRDVRWEIGVEAGSTVSTRYDPMIAKVVSRSEDRPGAIHLMRSALRQMRIDGVATNRALLTKILECPDFRKMAVTTGFLDEHPELLRASASPEVLAFHAIAAVLHAATKVVSSQRLHPFAPYAWCNTGPRDDVVVLRTGDHTMEVRYRQLRDDTWRVAVDASEHVVRVFGRNPDRIDLEISAVRRTARITGYDDKVIVETAEGESTFVGEGGLDEAVDGGGSGSCVASTPGTVVAVLAAVGDQVEIGDTLVVLEAMKMEHRLKATGPGQVAKVLVGVGDNVEYKQLLVDVVAEGTAS